MYVNTYYSLPFSHSKRMLSNLKHRSGADTQSVILKMREGRLLLVQGVVSHLSWHTLGGGCSPSGFSGTWGRKVLQG